LDWHPIPFYPFFLTFHIPTFGDWMVDVVVVAVAVAVAVAAMFRAKRSFFAP
jgi:hypothetical protein